MAISLVDHRGLPVTATSAEVIFDEWNERSFRHWAVQ